MLHIPRQVLCLHFYYGVKSKDVDVMLSGSTPPTQGLLFGVLKSIKKVPFVYALQDIFPDSLVGTGLAKKGGLLWKIGRVIENFTYISFNFSIKLYVMRIKKSIFSLRTSLICY